MSSDRASKCTPKEKSPWNTGCDLWSAAFIRVRRAILAAGLARECSPFCTGRRPLRLGTSDGLHSRRSVSQQARSHRDKNPKKTYSRTPSRGELSRRVRPNGCSTAATSIVSNGTRQSNQMRTERCGTGQTPNFEQTMLNCWRKNHDIC